MNYYIIYNHKWRMWVFKSKDKDRAYRFASFLGLEVKQVKEIPFCAGYTVYA